MEHKFLLIISLILTFLNTGCAQNSSYSISDERYKKYKNNFELRFIDHFPTKILTRLDGSNIFSDRDEKKNDFNLLLYEYGVSEKDINDILNEFRNKSIAKYKITDSCLLIVNRFETKETLENYEIPVIRDSSLLNKTCYNSKYPIPNFVNFLDVDKVLSFDNSFTIYVLESKKVISWDNQFKMGPAPQMPNNWKNGFSKGIVVSEEKKTVIYWTVIW